MHSTLNSDIESSSDVSTTESAIFRRLQMVYLIGYTLASIGNNLQGSYRYALFDSYNIPRSTIELIYLSAHLSTLFLGTLASSLADKFGRRLSCVLCGVMYILSCATLNFNILWLLFLGGVLRGIGHSLFNTNFEAWLIQEHHNNCLSNDSLKRVLRNAFFLFTLTAIGTGVVCQVSAEHFGYVAPFDIALGAYIVMIIFILCTWGENYGDKHAKAASSFVSAIKVLRDDPRIILIGLVTGFVEATLYIYTIEWTPTLQAAKKLPIHKTLPLGLIFSCLMFFNMLGTLAFKPLSQHFKAQSYMIGVILLAAAAMITPIVLPNYQALILASFCVFEFCIGIYRPAFSLLRSHYLPDAVRATLMNYFRIPRFIFMFGIIIWHFELYVIFIYCAVMLLLAVVCLLVLRKMKGPEELLKPSETMVLLSQAPSYDLKMKQPQPIGNPTMDGIDNIASSIEINKE